MEDIVAVRVLTETGKVTYFLTWGRIQDEVDPAPLEALILRVASHFKTPGRAVTAELCGSLQEASEAPYFYEHFFGFCQERVEVGKDHDDWRQRMDQRMNAGYEIAGIGPYE